MISAVIEAAFRSALLALAVGAGLRMFRVRNVLAQKSAWGLVLAAAFLMPVLAPIAGKWQLSPSVNLPSHPLGLLEPVLPQFTAFHTDQPQARPATPSMKPQARPVAEYPVSGETTASVAPDSAAALISQVYQGVPPLTIARQQVAGQRTLSFSEFFWVAYFSVAVTLCLRLFFGLASAVLLWRGSEPVVFLDEPDLATDLRVRASREVASPVTIGSAVVLPADHVDWDAAKLRVVLAHERSHIRQGDFYLQFLAALYAAIVWFSPLGWWLKSKLSDLAETISDRAGLEQAANGSSYAQILLEFAAAPRPTLTGVAMARSGSLSRRIERLLNEGSFRQAFAGGRGRVLVAVLLVPIALFLATALVRVKAAGQDAQAQPSPAAPEAAPVQAIPQARPAPAQSEAPITGQAIPPEPDVDTISPPQPMSPTPASPVIAPASPSIPEPAPRAEDEPVIVVPSAPSVSRALRAPRTARAVLAPPAPPMAIRLPALPRVYRLVQKSTTDGYSYHYSSNGNSYGIVRGNGQPMSFSGDLRTADIDKIRKQAHGDFLWFKRDGKYYFVDDQATLNQIEAMYKPIEDLGRQQAGLGRKQEELGRQQEALGRQQEQVSLNAPDISKEMAEVNDAMAKLQSKMGKTVTQAELSDLQDKLGDLQGRLGSLQGGMGAKQGEFGAQQSKLGAEQGRLGAEQGKLGAEQGRLAAEADRRVQSIIDQSLENGKAHPVQ
jgi:hypothetical protein